MVHDSSLPLQAMKYLSYALLPLCIGLAVYNLLYTPHKRYAALVFVTKPAFIIIGRLVLYPVMKYSVHALFKVSITPNMSVEIVGKIGQRLCAFLWKVSLDFHYLNDYGVIQYSSKLIFKISNEWSLIYMKYFER